MIYKKIAMVAAAVAMSFTMVSCGPNSKSGAVVGGLIGAGAGAIIGNQSGRGLEGAAIGGAIGAAGGALAGDARDDREYGYSRGRGYNDGGGRSRRGGGHYHDDRGGRHYDDRGGRYYDDRRRSYGGGYNDNYHRY